MATFAAADLPTGTTNNITNFFELHTWAAWALSDLYGGLGVQDNNGRNRPRYMWDVGTLPDGNRYIYSEAFTPIAAATWGLDGKKPWKNVILPSSTLVLPASYKS